MNIHERTVLIFDFANLAKRMAFSSHVKVPGTQFDIDYQVLTFSIWNSIYKACLRHKPTCVIIAHDYGSWRKIIYEPYKMNRKLDALKNKDKPGINWDEFFLHLNEFVEDFASSLPIVSLRLQHCEADDIIGIVCKNLSKDNKIIIVSTDYDYAQCLKYSNVKLFNPGSYNVHAGFINIDFDSDSWIDVMSLVGQGKDNIYNVFTPLDFPISYNILRESKEIECIRKPSFPKKKAWNIVNCCKLDEFLDNYGPKEARLKNAKLIKENEKRVLDGKKEQILYCENVRERFELNKRIISFDMIPKTLENALMQQIEMYELPEPSKMIEFFVRQKWNEPLDKINEVESVMSKLY